MALFVQVKVIRLCTAEGVLFFQLSNERTALKTHNKTVRSTGLVQQINEGAALNGRNKTAQTKGLGLLPYTTDLVKIPETETVFSAY